MWAINVRFAHYQRCTNYSRRYCIEDYTQCLIKIKYKIRRTSEKKTFQTTDHLTTYRLLEQKCQEWGIKMWIATRDFMKTFDTISHNSIWETLLSCNVEYGYFCLLRKIYKDQKISVQTDEESEIFDMQKDSKQGSDVKSAVQHDAVVCIKKRNTTMTKEKRNGRDLMTNLRFTDNVMLFVISKEQIRNMMCEFKDAIEKVDSGCIPTRRKFSEIRATWTPTQKDKLKSTKWASKYWQRVKAWNIWIKESLSTNKRDSGNQK